MKLLAPWKKSYDQLSMLKSRDITLPTKAHLVKAMVFSISHVWIWELDYKESWVLKNWCFWTVVLENTLDRVPWTARRSNQSILKKMNPEYSLERLILKLKLQYFDLLMRRDKSLGKTLMLGKIEGRRRRGHQRMRWLNDITNWTDMSLSKLQEMCEGQGSLACCIPWGGKESDTTERLNNNNNNT